MTSRQEPSLKQETLSSLIWKLFERGGNAVVQLAVQIVMARLLAPEEFGALAIILVFVNIGNAIVQSGLNTSIVQAQTVEDSDLSTVFWLSFGTSIVLCLLVYISAPAIASFYSLDYLIWPLRVMGFLLLVTAFNSVQVAIVQRDLKLRKVFNATIAAVIVSGIAGIVSATAGAGLWALVLQQLIYQFSNCLFWASRLNGYRSPYLIGRKLASILVLAGNSSFLVYWIKAINLFQI